MNESRGRMEGDGNGKPVSAPTPFSRVSVVETLYYHSKGNQPHVVQTRFGHNVTTDEQVFFRRLTLNTDWMDLEKGWINNHSYVIIQNMEGRVQDKNPTKDERAVLATRIVEISFGVGAPVVSDDGPRDMHSRARPALPEPIPHLLLPAGETIRLSPLTLQGLRLRSRVPGVKIVVHVIPG